MEQRQSRLIIGIIGLVSGGYSIVLMVVFSIIFGLMLLFANLDPEGFFLIQDPDQLAVEQLFFNIIFGSILVLYGILTLVSILTMVFSGLMLRKKRQVAVPIILLILCFLQLSMMHIAMIVFLFFYLLSRPQTTTKHLGVPFPGCPKA